MIGYGRYRWPGPVNPAGGGNSGLIITSKQMGLSTGTMATPYRQLWNIALSPVDLSKSFAVISGMRTGDGITGFKFKLTSTTNLEVYIINNSNSTSAWAFYWAVFTCENISVQRGEVAQAFGGSGLLGPTGVTISSAPLASSFLIHSGIDHSINSASPPAGSIGHTAPTTLTWYLRATAASTVYLPWQLVTVEG